MKFKKIKGIHLSSLLTEGVIKGETFKLSMEAHALIPEMGREALKQQE